MSLQTFFCPWDKMYQAPDENKRTAQSNHEYLTEHTVHKQTIVK